jgi:uridine phosphorylase
LDGAFCEHSEEEKIAYLKYLNENGVANIEMESTVFASLTHRAGNCR